MRVTYIKHSGFLVEWEDIACLFDWAEGELPSIEEGKKTFVFVSHAHADHFSPEIFQRFRGEKNVTFVLSADIRQDQEKERGCAVTRVAADIRRVFPGGKAGPVSVTTLLSTDSGVAFVVNYGGKTVLHAGDLHWWAWPDDTPAEEREMKNAFFDQLLKIRGLEVDAAFLPLDPRLGGNFWMGFDAFMRTARVKKAFPMHMWDRYDYIENLRRLGTSAPYRDRIVDVNQPGQVFELT